MFCQNRQCVPACVLPLCTQDVIINRHAVQTPSSHQLATDLHINNNSSDSCQTFVQTSYTPATPTRRLIMPRNRSDVHNNYNQSRHLHSSTHNVYISFHFHSLPHTHTTVFSAFHNAQCVMSDANARHTRVNTTATAAHLRLQLATSHIALTNEDIQKNCAITWKQQNTKPAQLHITNHRTAPCGDMYTARCRILVHWRASKVIYAKYTRRSCSNTCSNARLHGIRLTIYQVHVYWMLLSSSSEIIHHTSCQGECTSNVCYNGETLSPIYTIQPVVNTVVKPAWQPGKCLNTQYNWLSNLLSNRVVQPAWQPVEGTVAVRSTLLSNRLSAVSCIETFNQLDNWFDNQLDVCLHDTAGCQTGCTTGCIV